jgi:hypothetical protein
MTDDTYRKENDIFYKSDVNKDFNELEKNDQSLNLNKKLFDNSKYLTENYFTEITETNILNKQIINAYNSLYEYDLTLPKFEEKQPMQTGGNQVISESENFFSLLKDSSSIYLPLNSEIETESYFLDDSFLNESLDKDSISITEDYIRTEDSFIENFINKLSSDSK